MAHKWRKLFGVILLFFTIFGPFFPHLGPRAIFYFRQIFPIFGFRPVFHSMPGELTRKACSASGHQVGGQWKCTSLGKVNADNTKVASAKVVFDNARHTIGLRSPAPCRNYETPLGPELHIKIHTKSFPETKLRKIVQIIFTRITEF